MTDLSKMSVDELLDELMGIAQCLIMKDCTSHRSKKDAEPIRDEIKRRCK